MPHKLKIDHTTVYIILYLRGIKGIWLWGIHLPMPSPLLSSWGRGPKGRDVFRLWTIYARAAHTATKMVMDTAAIIIITELSLGGLMFGRFFLDELDVVGCVFFGGLYVKFELQ